ncbi:hypothetical protein LZ32DRAFT_685544 [Colletotrichum eremochloae]|nr:hypothetical protein LZ32DRAFT_685544 [Colletotrichum eremochloae]
MLLTRIAYHAYLLQNKNLVRQWLLRPGGGKETTIPQHVWQIYFPPEGGDTHNQLRNVPEWTRNAFGFKHTLVGQDIGDAFMEEHFDSRTNDVYRLIRNPALKSDFLRYAILLQKGGYYSDLDTKPAKPLVDWLPKEFDGKVGLLIAPEHDDGINPEGWWPHPVQICQWTFAAAPGHPALERMLQRAIAGLEDLANAQAVPIDQIRPLDREVLNATGPPAWTEVVFETIRDMAPEITTYEDLSRLSEPRLFGDILLLPLDAFTDLNEEEKAALEGLGQHQLVHHEFAGAWKAWTG